MTQPLHGVVMATIGIAAIGAFIGACYLAEYIVRRGENGGLTVVIFGVMIGYAVLLLHERKWKERWQQESDRMKAEHRKEIEAILRPPRS